MKRVHGFVSGVTVCSVLVGGSAQAATYYVAKTGNDNSSCSQAQTASGAKQTFAGGLSCLNAGDTLYVRQGTYNESLVNNVPSGTSWSNKVRIANYPGETVWLKVPNMDPAKGLAVYLDQSQQYIEFDGINFDGSQAYYGSVQMSSWSGGNPHHIRFQNLESIGNSNVSYQHFLASTFNGSSQGGNEFINLTIHGGGISDFDHGMYISSSDTLIEGNNIYDVPGAGIQIYNGSGVAFGNITLRNNTVHDLRSTRAGQRHWGIIIASNVTGTKIYNNVVYNIPSNGAGAPGIHLFGGASSEVYNNTVYDAAGDGILISDSASSTVVKNNIAYRNGTDYANSGSATSSANNLFGIDPLFVDERAGNFQLQSTSPAKDTGTSIGFITTDIAGGKRPEGSAPDIGAYEFRVLQSVTPPTPTGLRIVAN
jgi:parallel beta-helix repeat protein